MARKVTAIVCGARDVAGTEREVRVRRPWWQRPFKGTWRVEYEPVPPLDERIRASLIGAGGVGEMTREERVSVHGPFDAHQHAVYSMETTDGAA